MPALSENVSVLRRAHQALAARTIRHNETLACATELQKPIS